MKRILSLFLTAVLLVSSMPLFSLPARADDTAAQETVLFDNNCDKLMQHGDSVSGNAYPHQYFADSVRKGVEEGTVYLGGTGETPGYASWILPFETTENSFSLEIDMNVKSLMVPAQNDIWSGIVVEVNTPNGSTVYFSFHGIEENDAGNNVRMMVMKNSRSEEGAYSQDFILPADGNFHKWTIMYDGQSEVRFFIDQKLIGAFADVSLFATNTEPRVMIKNIHLDRKSGLNEAIIDNVKMTAGISMEKVEIAYAGVARNGSAKALTLNTHLTDIKETSEITVTVASKADPAKSVTTSYRTDKVDSSVVLNDIPFSGMTDITLSVSGGMFPYTFPYYLYADTVSAAPGDSISAKTPDVAYQFDAFDKITLPENSLWKLRYFHYPDGGNGTLISITGQANAPAVTIPVTATGKFAVYVGYVHGTKGVYVNDREISLLGLTGANDTVAEVFAFADDFSGESITVRPADASQARIAYVKLVSLSDEKYEKYLAEDDSHHLLTDNDGYSIFCSKGYDNPTKLIDTVIERYAKGIDQRQFNWCVFVTSYLNYDSPVWWEYVTKRLKELNVPEEKWPENFLDKVDKNGNKLNYDELMLDIDKTAFSNILAINSYGTPHEFLSDYVKENDYGELFVSLRMSAYYTGIWEHMNSTFFYLHPEWKRGGSYQFSYIHEEYRNYLHDLLMELASYKNVDGITMDFGRYYYIFGTELTDVGERTKIMNDFVKWIHDDLPEDKVLNVRVLHPTEQKALVWGLDYQHWVENDWVDRVIISDQSAETFFDVTPYAEFFNQHEDVQFYLGINATISGHDLTKEEENILKAGGTIRKGEVVSREQIMLRAYEAYMAGADGIFFFNGLGTDPVYTNLNNKTKMVRWYEYEYPASLVTLAISTPSANPDAVGAKATATVEARPKVLALPVSDADWQATPTIEASGKTQSYQSHGKTAEVSYVYYDKTDTLQLDVRYNLNSWLYDLVLTDAAGNPVPFQTDRKYGGYNEGQTLWGFTYEANGHADAVSVISLTVENVPELPDKYVLFASNCGTSTQFTAKITIEIPEGKPGVTAAVTPETTAAPETTNASDTTVPAQTTAADSEAAAAPETTDAPAPAKANNTPVYIGIGAAAVIIIAAAAIILGKKKKS